MAQRRGGLGHIVGPMVRVLSRDGLAAEDRIGAGRTLRAGVVLDVGAELGDKRAVLLGR